VSANNEQSKNRNSFLSPRQLKRKILFGSQSPGSDRETIAAESSTNRDSQSIRRRKQARNMVEESGLAGVRPLPFASPTNKSLPAPSRVSYQGGGLDLLSPSKSTRFQARLLSDMGGRCGATTVAFIASPPVNNAKKRLLLMSPEKILPSAPLIAVVRTDSGATGGKSVTSCFDVSEASLGEQSVEARPMKRRRVMFSPSTCIASNNIESAVVEDKMGDLLLIVDTLVPPPEENNTSTSAKADVEVTRDSSGILSTPIRKCRQLSGVDVIVTANCLKTTPSKTVTPIGKTQCTITTPKSRATPPSGTVASDARAKTPDSLNKWHRRKQRFIKTTEVSVKKTVVPTGDRIQNDPVLQFTNAGFSKNTTIVSEDTVVRKRMNVRITMARVGLGFSSGGENSDVASSVSDLSPVFPSIASGTRLSKDNLESQKFEKDLSLEWLQPDSPVFQSLAVNTASVRPNVRLTPKFRSWETNSAVKLTPVSGYQSENAGGSTDWGGSVLRRGIEGGNNSVGKTRKYSPAISLTQDTLQHLIESPLLPESSGGRASAQEKNFRKRCLDKLFEEAD